ncbi:hypothetical protein CBR55_34285, partial [Bacillus thuringiensis]
LNAILGGHHFGASGVDVKPGCLLIKDSPQTGLESKNRTDFCIFRGLSCKNPPQKAGNLESVVDIRTFFPL